MINNNDLTRLDKNEFSTLDKLYNFSKEAFGGLMALLTCALDWFLAQHSTSQMKEVSLHCPSSTNKLRTVGENMIARFTLTAFENIF